MQITVDAIENQAMVGTVISVWRHIVLKDVAWLRSFQTYARRRGFKHADDLFVYYHTLADSFTLSVWMERPGTDGRPGTMKELEVLNGHPGRLGARMPRFDYLMERLMPMVLAIKGLRRRMLADARARLSERETEQEEREGYAKHLERKFGFHDNAARLIRQGVIPYAPVDTKSDQARQFLEQFRDPDRVIDNKHRYKKRR